MENIFIKKASNNILSELKDINFDLSYLSKAEKKYKGAAYKIFNLKPYEANILKQLCLSLGFDCAISRNSVTCKCETTDCILFASFSQLEKLINKLKEQPFRLKIVSEKLNQIINETTQPLIIRNFIFDWKRPYIMGILNVTPDSFSDGGKYNSPKKALEHCIKLINDGADIIDIGGESTRPNADFVPVEEEIKRVIPVINSIRNQGIDIPISVDTRNYETASAAIAAGADIINDVSGFDYDNNLFNYAVSNNIPSVIMHSNKIPAIKNDFTQNSIIDDIYKNLDNKIQKLINSGLNGTNIIADVGIGFGKSGASDFEILRRMSEFKGLNVPLLLGISRKSFIRNAFDLTADEADTPTAFYSAISENVNIHRVHNVAMTKKYMEYFSKLYSD